ncbi:hypothetical protein M6B38_282145 [Iris pallida]|uniref:Uncharacterized protein n=1 Tax=Iris pallida TaxID=29817 RepID=A0AAX6I040_IRIPA|nr:hypothetical protein M6B38_282145 [Iris pallida]
MFTVHYLSSRSHTLIVISNACYTDSIVHCSGSGTMVSSLFMYHSFMFMSCTIVHIVTLFHAFQFTLFSASCWGCTLLFS